MNTLLSYELWSVEQLKVKRRCRVERGISCIPLRSDPICRACYEADVEPEDANDRA